MKTIKSVGIVGSGQMGSGIAQSCAASGLSVVLWDKEPSFVTRALQSIEGHLKKNLEKKKISPEDFEGTLSRISTGGSIDTLIECDLIIEAIVEQFDTKSALFRTLDSLCNSRTILASNTSSVSITKLAAATKRADRFVGIHFMNPVPVMKLVEIVEGLQTSTETMNTAKQFVEQLNKTSVVALDSPGFIVNRILVPMINEAIFLLQEGVAAKDIDNAMKLGTNQPMGPLELADFVGLDTLLYILRILHDELGEDKYRPCPLLIRYVDSGLYGKKTGRGFYTY